MSKIQKDNLGKWQLGIVVFYILMLVVVIISTTVFYNVNQQNLCCTEMALQNIEIGEGALSDTLSEDINLFFLGFYLQNVILFGLYVFNTLFVFLMLIFRRNIKTFWFISSFLFSAGLSILAILLPEAGMTYWGSLTIVPVTISLVALSIIRYYLSDKKGNKEIIFSLLNIIFLVFYILFFFMSFSLYFD